MKIICSWCKKFIGEKEPFDDPSESHAKCAECLTKQKTGRPLPKAKGANKKSCGLCGKTQDLTKTECCLNQVCEKCFMKHTEFTLCGYHFNNSHPGIWQECTECLKQFPTEMYVWYGTNKDNFEKLQNPPSFNPTHCSTCGKIIPLPEGGYTKFGPDHWCRPCSIKRH